MRKLLIVSENSSDKISIKINRIPNWYLFTDNVDIDRNSILHSYLFGGKREYIIPQNNNQFINHTSCTE